MVTPEEIKYELAEVHLANRLKPFIIGFHKSKNIRKIVAAYTYGGK